MCLQTPCSQGSGPAMETVVHVKAQHCHSSYCRGQNHNQSDTGHTRRLSKQQDSSGKLQSLLDTLPQVFSVHCDFELTVLNPNCYLCERKNKVSGTCGLCILGNCSKMGSTETGSHVSERDKGQLGCGNLAREEVRGAWGHVVPRGPG